VAASADPRDKAAEFAENTGFDIGYGVDQAQADALGAYWQSQRHFIQPAEFLLNPENKISMVSYSDGPLARMTPDDVFRMVSFLEDQKKS